MSDFSRFFCVSGCLNNNEQLAMRNEQWVFRSALSGRTDIIEITLRLFFQAT
ncbi:MAG: hypothetical protein IJV35_08755 [Neisseriaceae bacterium]|nr:hypothetical protein [Neisseriaceae bacterium]